MLPGTKKKILVVDDEDDIRKTLADYLSRNGYFVSTAHSGKEGLRLAKGEHPDLVILDLMLPDIDGSDVAVELLANQQTRDIPIIF